MYVLIADIKMQFRLFSIVVLLFKQLTYDMLKFFVENKKYYK